MDVNNVIKMQQVIIANTMAADRVADGGNMENIQNIQQVMFIVVPVFIGLVFTFMLFMMFSSKFRGRMMSKQVKAMKHMTDYVKDDMTDVLTNLGSISANAQNNIINQNEDKLRNIANKTANISKDAITTTVRAIKDGFTDGNKPTIYCKHCGATIDADSRFCKTCGKEQ